MAIINTNYVVFTISFPIIFFDTCSAIKCYDCNSENNSACLDMMVHKKHVVVPVVDCGTRAPAGQEFFCRKIQQTILHPDHTPEVRITRSCGWVRHKRECYKADNADHLEMVCQCFGDMCNGAATATAAVTAAVSAILAFVAT